MHRHPTQGVKGSKPRLPTNGKPVSKAEVQRLSREYLEIRNRQMHAKAFMAETTAAAARGKLIAKDLVAAQAAYLLVAMRQKILNPAVNLCSQDSWLEGCRCRQKGVAGDGGLRAQRA